MSASTRGGALVLTISRRPGRPWWWDVIEREALGCRLEHEVVTIDGPRPAGPLSRGFFPMASACLRHLFRARRDRLAYLITFECDWTSFLVAAVQTVLGQRWPRHVIVQFIMREKAPTFTSRAKYALMRWCFSSVHMCICSSRLEARYYVEAFGWEARKVGYVPLHTDPGFLARQSPTEERRVIAAGRTFRDYRSLLQASPGIDAPLTIVASPASLAGETVPDGVEVRFDVPIEELIALIATSMVVVLPLEERQISIGQSVLVEAMTMGKPVVVTRVNGTVDYVEHMVTGILVPPRDPDALREAVNRLVADPELRRRMGAAAQAQVLARHMPSRYAADVAALLRNR